MLNVLIIFGCLLLPSIVLAETTISLPKHSVIHQLLLKNQKLEWVEQKKPERTQRVISLVPGEYKYILALKSSRSSFSGHFIVNEGDNMYIHRAISPNRKSVFSWVSMSKPRSEEYKIERDEQFCSVIHGVISEQYTFEACKKLSKLKKTKGLFGMGEAYSKGKGGVKENLELASQYYLESYRGGLEDGGISYYYLNSKEPVAFNIIKELAEKGNKWGLSAYANELAFGKNSSSDISLIQKYAIQAAQKENIDGLLTLSRLYFQREYENDEYLISAAAWYKIYAFNMPRMDYSARQLGEMIDEGLSESDDVSINNKIDYIIGSHLNSLYSLEVPFKIFDTLQKKGTLSLVFNNNYALDVTSLNSKLIIPFIVSKRSHEISVEIDGEFETSIPLNFEREISRNMCLTYDYKIEDLALITASSNVCKSSHTNKKSVWTKLKKQEI